MPETPQQHFEFGLEDLMWKSRIKSIRELSKRTSISASALRAMKNGESKIIHLSNLFALCKEFDCEIDDLIKLKKEAN